MVLKFFDYAAVRVPRELVVKLVIVDKELVLLLEGTQLFQGRSHLLVILLVLGNDNPILDDLLFELLVVLLKLLVFLLQSFDAV